MTSNNGITKPTGKQRGSGSPLRRLVMLSNFLKSSDAWFVLFMAFSFWSFFIAKDDPLINVINLLVGLGLLIIWNLNRIAEALENKK